MYLVSSDLQAEVEWQGPDEHGSVYVNQLSPEYPVSKNINILYDRSAWYNIEKAVMIVYRRDKVRVLLYTWRSAHRYRM
jgi:hypothetical protein